MQTARKLRPVTCTRVEWLALGQSTNMHMLMQRAEVERIGKWAKDGRDRQRHLGGERARSKAQARHRLASLLQGWRRSASHLTRFRSPGVARGYMRPAKLCSQPRRPRLKLRHGQCGQGQAGSEPGRRQRTAVLGDSASDVPLSMTAK